MDPYPLRLVLYSLYLCTKISQKISQDTLERLINAICFDHMTRFLCSDSLKCHITLQCDTALVITLSASALN